MDTFGTCTKCPSERVVRLIESQIKVVKLSKERQGPTMSARFTEVFVRRESTVLTFLQLQNYSLKCLSCPDIISDPSMESFGYFSGAISNGRLSFAVLNLCS